MFVDQERNRLCQGSGTVAKLWASSLSITSSRTIGCKYGRICLHVVCQANALGMSHGAFCDAVSMPVILIEASPKRAW
jgi:hypothetical protein